MGITSKPFGNTKDGQEVQIYTLQNSNGMIANITNYGGIIVSLLVPDKDGNLSDVVLGFDTFDRYLGENPFFGAIIGRHANRIENSEFTLNGVRYSLAKNEGENHLHGGTVGFDKVVWDGEIIRNGNCDVLQLSYRSVDGEENYPGNLDTRVTYTLTDENELKIEYFAVSDKDTVVNLTNHSYFNLGGHDSGDVLKHQLMINADKFTVVDEYSIPTGEIREVAGTPMDFRSPKPIGKDINADDEQIKFGTGYDHNWVLNNSGRLDEMAAQVYEPGSGRIMEVYTTKPGVQFYSANFLDGSITGKGGKSYMQRCALCLETQYFPNAMKHKHFPSPVLKAGDEYRHTTIYKFSTK